MWRTFMSLDWPWMSFVKFRGVAIDISTVHDFHGSADNPSVNGTLCHQDIDLALTQRAQEIV